MDKAGNAVSLTYTINGYFGAGVMAGETGFFLNDEMDDFTVKPGVPNLFGLVQGARNAIAPGKRPLSSMAPTIVLRDGKVALVAGSPGGSRIITINAQTLINVLDFGMEPQEAVDAPRIHHQWLPDTVYAEPFALSADTQGILRGMGHTIVEQRPWGRAGADRGPRRRAGAHRRGLLGQRRDPHRAHAPRPALRRQRQPEAGRRRDRRVTGSQGRALRQAVRRRSPRGTGISAPVRGFPGDFAEADVAAAEPFRPVDPGHRRVGAVLGVGDAVAERRDREHPAAVGEQLAALVAGAGLEHERRRRPRPRRRPGSPSPAPRPRDSPAAAITTVSAARWASNSSVTPERSPSLAESKAGTRSEARRGISTCASGSPKRALYSMSLGPSAVSIRPA